MARILFVYVIFFWYFGIMDGMFRLENSSSHAVWCINGVAILHLYDKQLQ